MDKIAILILCHKNPRQLSQLVSAIDDNRFDIYIHVDAKSNERPFKETIIGQTSKSNVYFVKKRTKTFFFDFSLIEATYNCIETAIEHDNYKYYILLTGQDYPIKSNNYIYDKLINNYPICWIDMYSVEEAKLHNVKWVENIGYRRVSQKIRRFLSQFFGNRLYYSTGGKPIRAIAVAYDILYTFFSGSPRKKISNTTYTYSAGSHFWMLPDIAIKHLLSCYKNDTKLNNIFHNIGAPEESYFQTALSSMPNLQLPDEYIQFTSHEHEMDNPALRLIKWYENGAKTNGHPGIWKSEDIKFILSANALFARKFDMRIDQTIIQEIDTYRHKS